MERFIRASFGSFLEKHFTHVFTRPSRQSFLILALGWTLAGHRHQITSYLWRAAATSVKHFTRFYVFLGGPFCRQTDQLWRQVIRLALAAGSADRPLRVRFDGTVCKKAGRKIEGLGSYRNAAGTARQEYRTLRGLKFIIGEMLLELTPWEEHPLSVPIGLELYLRRKEAHRLGRPYKERGELARKMLDRFCELAGPKRTVFSACDGGYSTKKFLRGLPNSAQAIGRLPVGAVLFEEPPEASGKRGRPPKKGPKIGKVKQLARREESWQAHPAEDGTFVTVVTGIWHSVLPGKFLKVVIVWRPELKEDSQKKKLEAFFSTDTQLSIEQILEEYKGRWSIEITIKMARQHFGLGHDQCRTYRRILGINAFRMLMGAAEVVYVADKLRERPSPKLTRYRPWYRQKRGPSLYDVRQACREELYRVGITPTVGFWTDVEENQQRTQEIRPRAA